jgi:hypothetical protein
MAIDVSVVLNQIDAVLTEAHGAGGALILDDELSDERVNPQDAMVAVMLIVGCIERLAPPTSHYVTEVNRVRTKFLTNFPTARQYLPLVGILKALRADFAAGRLLGLRELIHADLFADMLEAAQHLLDETYKDPAAVLAGGTLEAHLRKLADKHGVATASPDGAPRKSSAIAVDLAKTPPGALSKLDSKSVTSWLDLRNDAAHGNHGKYVATQVAVMIQGIRDFITRLPA